MSAATHPDGKVPGDTLVTLTNTEVDGFVFVNLIVTVDAAAPGTNVVGLNVQLTVGAVSVLAVSTDPAPVPVVVQ